MRISFNRIAYEALQVCNALSLDAVEQAVATTRLGPGARILDIGTGNAAVSIRLARRFGFQVTAVELDPGMADLARARIEQAGVPLDLVQATSGAVLKASPPFDLIVAIGTTEPAGAGLRDPADIFASLGAHLVPEGFLLWGDVVWRDIPPEPLRQMMELTNTYADDAGWRAAAATAGLQVLSARMSPDAEWDGYAGAMQAAADAWLMAHPDDEAAPAVRRNADRVRLMLDFGRPHMDFGLYLLRKGPIRPT
ncbi:methyltransferase domain-containing protein [Rhizobium sp. CRIBSB]|nr:methyltransferase domain-containing protein [Rhizobium sp. CRIBSB]